MTDEQSRLPNWKKFSTRDRLIVMVGSCFGLGFCPFMSGTVASLAGPPMVQLVDSFGFGIAAQIVLLIVLVAIGTPVCTRLEELAGGHDPGIAVIDELAAFPFVFAPVILLPDCSTCDPKVLAAGFVWFRVFDIIKPWPVKRFEALPKGIGVMADDLVAGVFAAAALWATVTWVI